MEIINNRETTYYGSELGDKCHEATAQGIRSCGHCNRNYCNGNVLQGERPGVAALPEELQRKIGGQVK